MGFLPSAFVDITATREKRKAALSAHRSPDGQAIDRDHRQVMEDFRGRQLGVRAAEAFVPLPRDDVKRNLSGLG